MNRRRINHRLDKLITDLENLMYYMSKQRDKTSWADDLEFLEETIGYCEEANDKLRTARAPKHHIPCYIPDRRAPGVGLDFGRPLNDREIDDILLARYRLLTVYYRMKHGEPIGTYDVIRACKEITLPETLKIPTDLTGDALTNHLLDLINYTSKLLYSEIKEE